MYDTTERVRRVKQTALRLIQKRERTVLRRLGTLCTVLALGLTGALAHFTDGAPSAAVQGAYGATLLADSAGGHVLGGGIGAAIPRRAALTPPEIVRRIRAAKQAAQQAGAKLFVLDGAVIIGTAAEAECDKLCVVTAPFEVSVERIAARDGISPEMAARRLNAQTPEAVLTARADYILPNTSTREALAKAANELCDALIGEGCCA